MAREVDKRKTRKALRRLKRAADRAQTGPGPGLTEWEKDFVAGVTERLETYGSAFRDPSKGRKDEALSERQAAVARVLDRKSRPRKTEKDGEPGKPAKPPLRRGSGFKPKARPSSVRVRDIHEDVTAEPSEKAETPPPPRAVGRPRLRVIPGGDKP